MVDPLACTPTATCQLRALLTAVEVGGAVSNGQALPAVVVPPGGPSSRATEGSGMMSSAIA